MARAMVVKGFPRIAESRTATTGEWREHYERSASATFFEAPGWARLWEAYTDGRTRPAPRLFRFEDGVTVVAPWSRQQRRLGRRTVATPAGTYGGWLYRAEAAITPDHLNALYRELPGGDAVLRQNPFDPLAAEAAPPGGWTVEDFTQVVRLDRFEDVDRTLRKRQVYRKQRQGERAGLSLRRTTSPSDVDRYYDIYRASQARWGEDATNRHGRELFRAMDLKADWLDFWVVERDGEVVAGGPFFKAGGRHVVSWLMLADPDHLKARPFDFAYAHLIHHYCDAGYRYFDFNPSGGHEGVVKFKDNFGPERMPSGVFARRSLQGRLADRVRSLLSGSANE